MGIPSLMMMKLATHETSGMTGHWCKKISVFTKQSNSLLELWAYNVKIYLYNMCYRSHFSRIIGPPIWHLLTVLPKSESIVAVDIAMFWWQFVSYSTWLHPKIFFIFDKVMDLSDLAKTMCILQWIYIQQHPALPICCNIHVGTWGYRG